MKRLRKDNVKYGDIPAIIDKISTYKIVCDRLQAVVSWALRSCSHVAKTTTKVQPLF